MRSLVLCEKIRQHFPSLIICTVVGFPLGNGSTAAKVAETASAIADGADEIDMVIHIGALKEGNLSYVTDEIRQVKEAAGSHILKVIVETCYLTEEEKIAACRAVTEGGGDFIKTSTGFGSAGASLSDVKLFKKYVGPKVKIKAAGGIHSKRKWKISSRPAPPASAPAEPFPHCWGRAYNHEKSP